MNNTFAKVHFEYSYRLYRAVGSFFMVGVWVKMSTSMVYRRRNIEKKTQELKKTPQTSLPRPKKTKQNKKNKTKKRHLDRNINDSKFHIWNCFLIIFFRAYNFFIFVHMLQYTSSVFFLISDFAAESFKANKN